MKVFLRNWLVFTISNPGDFNILINRFSGWVKKFPERDVILQLAIKGIDDISRFDFDIALIEL